MPMLQKISATSYGYYEPALTKARTNVSLVDGAIKKIEPITTAVIKKTDGYVDAGYQVVEDRVVAVKGTFSEAKGSAYKRVSKVTDKVVDMKQNASTKALKVYNENPTILATHKKGMSFCDSMEALIDRLLPEPPSPEGSKTSPKKATKGKEQEMVLYRAIAIPLRIPVRTIHIVTYKIDGAIAYAVLKYKWAVNLTKDQKAKLSAKISTNSRQLMDKISNSSAVVTLKNSKTASAKKLEAASKSIEEGTKAIKIKFEEGTKAIKIKCYVLSEKYGLIHFKDVTLEKLDELQAVALQAAKSGCNTAYKFTTKVAGDERATFYFTKIGEKIPLVKSAISPEASTGSLEAAVPPAPRLRAGTGDTGAALQMPDVRMQMQMQMPEPQLKRSGESVEAGLSAGQLGLTGLSSLSARLTGMHAHEKDQ